jgi:DtxR family transcriptional regulator, Mn-dependent transcriptional regulator
MATEQIEEYLETIGRLEEKGERVITSSLAHELQVSPPSVTQMLGRLSERGLLSYHPRGEIALTEKGRALARSVMRRHRLWERFLHDVLGVRWDSVHGEACRLEHATSPLLERELARAVGDNATCPHGQAIPDVDGEILREQSIPLLQLSVQQCARVVTVEENDPILLKELETLGIEPGVMIQLRALDTETGEAVLRVGEVDLPVSIEVVRALHVAPGDSEEGAQAVSLAQLVAGQTGVVDHPCRGNGLGARCLALGFIPGTPITMIRNQKSGPLIVQVRDTRVALGRGEAQKIQLLRKGPTDGSCDETRRG